MSLIFKALLETDAEINHAVIAAVRAENEQEISGSPSGLPV
jgi:hypothetical protein